MTGERASACPRTPSRPRGGRVGTPRGAALGRTTSACRAGTAALEPPLPGMSRGDWAGAGVLALRGRGRGRRVAPLKQSGGRLPKCEDRTTEELGARTLACAGLGLNSWAVK